MLKSYFLFKKKRLDITDFLSFEKYILNYKIDCIINCAAYTNVDKSESDKKLAENINHISVDNIAKLCSKYSIQLIHISTDYVFDGNKSTHTLKMILLNRLTFMVTLNSEVKIKF